MAYLSEGVSWIVLCHEVRAMRLELEEHLEGSLPGWRLRSRELDSVISCTFVLAAF